MIRRFIDGMVGESVNYIMLTFVIGICFCVFYGSQYARLLFDESHNLIASIFNPGIIMALVLFIILLTIFVIHVKREFFD